MTSWTFFNVKLYSKELTKNNFLIFELQTDRKSIQTEEIEKKYRQAEMTDRQADTKDRQTVETYKNTYRNTGRNIRQMDKTVN